MKITAATLSWILISAAGTFASAQEASAPTPVLPPIISPAPPPNTAAPLPALPPVAPAAVEEYLNNFVWFENQLSVTTYSTGGYGYGYSHNTVVSNDTVPRKGKYHEPLDGIRFYLHINRPDLAKIYQKRSIARWSLLGGGSVLSIAGTVMLFVGLDQELDAETSCSYPYSWDGDPDAPEYLLYEACRDTARDEEEAGRNIKITGIVLLSVGGVAMIASAFINPHPIGMPEARRLAETYNNELKRRLGIPLEMQLSAAQRSIANTQGVRLKVTPMAAADAGGAMLNLVF